ncbi:MAG TPA: hypothetical protein VG939_00830 [Caulobacteraceae bacterium]|nr:hypothetical protein [Caulobacteraceae bacterium]
MMMKKIVLAAVAVASLGAALPAAAQPMGHGPHGDPGINDREREISMRIDRGQRDGSLSFREARMLRNQLDGIERLEARYARGGFSGWERADLNARLDRLSANVRDQRHDQDRGHDHDWGHDRRD